MRSGLPVTEQQRLARLAELDLLNDKRDQEFDDIARLACEIFSAPICTISFIDSDRVWIKSSHGIEIQSVPRNLTFCTNVLGNPQVPLVVADAQLDLRFCNNCFVTGEPRIRFYAGQPLITSDGIPIGVICVVDSKPREINPVHVEMLDILARQIMKLIESRNREVLLNDAVNQLKQSKEFLHAAGSIAKVGYWQVEVPSMKVHCSEITRSIYEVDADFEITVENGLAFYSDESRPTITKAFNDAVDQGTAFDVEVGFNTAKSRQLRVRVIGKPVLENGNVVAVAGVFQDITSITEAERDVRDIHRKLQKTSAHTPGFLYQFMLRPDGTSCFPYASEGIKHIYRVTPEQVRENANDVFRILHPDDYDRIVNSIQQSAQSLTEWRCEYRVKFDDGTCEWLEGKSTPEKQEDGTILWHGYITNVTSRVKAQQLVHENEQRLSVALEGANIGLWDWSPTTGDTYFSDCWYTMLGYHPSDLPMHVDTWKAILHPDDAAHAFEKLQLHFDGVDPIFRSEQRLRQKDGTYRWVQDVGRVVERDANGKPSRMIGVHIDIDSQKRVQAELEQARSQAEIANRSKSDFLANMSHEIRTPLTAILGFTEMLREAPTRENNLYVADTIQRNGEHLLTILNDILDLSKIEAQKLKIEILPVDLRTLIGDTVSLVSKRANEKNIQIITEIDKRIPAMIKTDPTRLRQIVLNIIGNAIKFTEQGSVKLAVTFENETKKGVQVKFEIQDTGIGMTDEQMKRLFRPFEQADKSTTRKFGGTGLGLTITNRITHMLGGDIQIASKVGKGTTFLLRFTFEVASESQNTDSLKGSAGVDQIDPSLKVMVVDDAPDNIKLVQFILGKLGLKPATALDGQQAIDKREEMRRNNDDFDLIILDMQMPVKDGYTTAAELRETGFEGRIIALTANAMSEVRMKCLAAGCDDFLTKPIDIRQLTRAISQKSNRSAA